MEASRPASPAERALAILEGNRSSDAPEVPKRLIEEIADIQEQNQYDDDRSSPRKALRTLVEQHARAMALKGSSSK